MVLNNYIATQNCCRTSQIFFKSLFIFFFWKRVFFFLIFLKNKTQHIPVVSHALWRGTLSLVKTVDVVPTTQNNWLIPSTGLSEFIYRGRRASQDWGSGSRKRVAERLRLRRDVFGWDYWSCPCCPLPVVVHKRIFRGQADQQWFLCTFSRVVPNFVFLIYIFHPPSWVPPQHVCPSLNLLHSPSEPACKLPFSHAVVSGRRPDKLTAKKWKKGKQKQLHISYKQFLYTIKSPKRLKRTCKVCHIYFFLFKTALHRELVEEILGRLAKVSRNI